MQRLKLTAPRTHHQSANPYVWGIATVAVVGLLLAMSAFVYLRPPGQQTVVFITDDVATVRVGDSVRVAGYPVGKVSDIELGDRRVRVTTHIDDQVYIGDRSQVQVRMLTAVGGYYINITPLGSRAAGDHPIPKDRVTLPYSLVQTLADVGEVGEDLETPPVRSSLDEVQDGLTGQRLQSLRTLLDTSNSLVSIMERQRGQVGKVLRLSREYLGELSGYREELSAMIGKAAILEQTLITYGDGFGMALTGLGEVTQRVKPFGVFYFNHRPEVLDAMNKIVPALKRLQSELAPMIENLRSTRTSIEAALGAGTGAGSRPPLLATDLCIPLPGKAC